MNKQQSSLHPLNKHKDGYNFQLLCEHYPKLKSFVFENKYGTSTIKFADPKAVKALNTALLKTYYGIGFWEFPDHHLCPPIPGRVDYIHHLNDLLKASKITSNITVFDIGTGATCIYPLLGHALYHWQFVASDIDEKALDCAADILEENKLKEAISLRFQNDETHILNGVIFENDRFDAMLCNPPFYKSKAEAQGANSRKLRGLGIEKTERNFSGTHNELWYPGGEKAFLHNYLYQSSLVKAQCFWFTSLVSKKDNVKPMKESLKKLGATEVKVIPMHQGNKVTRIVAWTFLTPKQQQEWGV